ncbi:uncharacterized protein CCOS01_11667 [Colletotrichum costaricense]|uniref:Uncharacterized protein n=1 Tax=Colletotrichum costaricense TaxID=1209916 RepID=A0AAJ0DWS7_9PEZI|nr:uncharacterized protein CCOS01_11667 [Colletotrichum costaricense]KAK1518847.1 hypothetical protein CCOS01_11667 [Colletotrichum costaricense]
MKAEVSEHRDCRYFNLEPFRARPSPSDCTAPTPALAQTHTLLAIRCIHNHDPTPVQSGPAPPGPVPRRHWEGAGGSFSLSLSCPSCPSPVLWQDRLTLLASACLPVRVKSGLRSAPATHNRSWQAQVRHLVPVARCSPPSTPCSSRSTRPIPPMSPAQFQSWSLSLVMASRVPSLSLILFSLAGWCSFHFAAAAWALLLCHHCYLTTLLPACLFGSCQPRRKHSKSKAAPLLGFDLSPRLFFSSSFLFLTIPTTPSPFLLLTTTYSDPPRPPISHDHELPHRPRLIPTHPHIDTHPHAIFAHNQRGESASQPP